MQKNLFIFIHGIGSSHETWNQYLRLLKDDDDFSIEDEKLNGVKDTTSNYYTFFNYDSPIVNKRIFFPKIRAKLAGEVEPGNLSIISHSDALVTFIQNKADDYDNIIIFAHSMGGLISLSLLFSLIRQNNTKVLKKIKKTIFFATPLAGSDNSADIKNFFDNKITKNLFSYAVEELSPESHTIVNTQERLKKYKNHLRKMDILYLYGSTDGRIESESKKLAETFFTKTDSFQLNHTEIKEPKNETSPVYRSVKNFINKKLEEEHLNELNDYDKSIKKLENHWHDTKKTDTNHSSFIILESHYTNTIYTNNTFIAYLKYKFKMMEDGIIKFDHNYMPFDKIVKQNIEEDEFYNNYAINRFTSKSYKVNICPSDIPLECSKPQYYKDENNKEWVKWNFSSEIISKGTEFIVEISVSDRIDISNTEEAKKRRKEYFTYTIDNNKRPHGVRYNKYQIETYNDTYDKNVELPFEPWMWIDGNAIHNKNNCKKNVYYKTWCWDFYYCNVNSKETKIKLRESESLIKHGADCTES